MEDRAIFSVSLRLGHRLLVLLDDFVIPLRARSLGYQIVHDPEAVAIDFAAPSVEGEFTRRVRLAVGSFRELRHFVGMRLDPGIYVAFFSHKVLRWVLLPYAMEIPTSGF